MSQNTKRRVGELEALRRSQAEEILSLQRDHAKAVDNEREKAEKER